MTALITGASCGLGREFALLCAKDGYDVVLVARRIDVLLELKTQIQNEYGVKAFVLQKDLTLKESTREVFDFACENNLMPDILINNAGFGDYGFFAECDLQKQQNMIALNIRALIDLTRLFLPHMNEHGVGRILNVASVASFAPGPKMSVYYASKAFVRSFTEAVSVELKKTHSPVTVTALCPGPIKSSFWDICEAQSSSIFSHIKFADVKYIARYGYKKMNKGCVVAVPFFSVKLLTFMTKILPRSIVRKFVYSLQK